MITRATTSWWDSSATFKKCTVEKVSFVLLSLFDLTITVVAVVAGLTELNPLMRFLIQTPVLLLLIKLLVPIGIAWLVPGRLLLPSIGLLGLVSVWNIKEMLVFIL